MDFHHSASNFAASPWGHPSPSTWMYTGIHIYTQYLLRQIWAGLNRSWHLHCITCAFLPQGNDKDPNFCLKKNSFSCQLWSWKRNFLQIFFTLSTDILFLYIIFCRASVVTHVSLSAFRQDQRAVCQPHFQTKIRSGYPELPPSSIDWTRCAGERRRHWYPQCFLWITAESRCILAEIENPRLIGARATGHVALCKWARQKA